VGNATRIGGRRPSRMVLPRGLEVEGQTMCVLPHGLGGLEDQKSLRTWRPSAFGSAFWALGGRGAR
jgi:hypothetical protein